MKVGGDVDVEGGEVLGDSLPDVDDLSGASTPGGGIEVAPALVGAFFAIEVEVGDGTTAGEAFEGGDAVLVGGDVDVGGVFGGNLGDVIFGWINGIEFPAEDEVGVAGNEFGGAVEPGGLDSVGEVSGVEADDSDEVSGDSGLLLFAEEEEAVRGLGEAPLNEDGFSVERLSVIGGALSVCSVGKGELDGLRLGGGEELFLKVCGKGEFGELGEGCWFVRGFWVRRQVWQPQSAREVWRGDVLEGRGCLRIA